LYYGTWYVAAFKYLTVTLNRLSFQAQALSEYLESEGVRGAGVVAACKGVPVLVEVILETENQRMLNALMGACVGVLPARKVNEISSNLLTYSRCVISIRFGIRLIFVSFSSSSIFQCAPSLLLA